jgi:hypothetical protein
MDKTMRRTAGQIVEKVRRKPRSAPASGHLSARTDISLIVDGAFSFELARIWVSGRGGANPGIGANWDIYPGTGWVGLKAV